jgi:hypothetical protein
MGHGSRAHRQDTCGEILLAIAMTPKNVTHARFRSTGVAKRLAIMSLRAGDRKMAGRQGVSGQALAIAANSGLFFHNSLNRCGLQRRRDCPKLSPVCQWLPDLPAR